MLARLQGFDDPLFVSRRKPRKKRCFFRGVGKFRVGHLLDVTAKQHDRCVETDFFADLACDQIVITGDNFDRHAVTLQSFDRRSSRFLRWVQKGDIAVKNQVSLVVLGIGCRVPHHGASRVNVFAGDCQDAEAIGGKCLVFFLQLFDMRVIHRVEFVIEREVRTAREYLFWCSLADNSVFAFRCSDDDRHDPTLEVEGDLVHFCILGDLRMSVDLCMGQHRTVQDVL